MVHQVDEEIVASFPSSPHPSGYTNRLVFSYFGFNFGDELEVIGFVAVADVGIKVPAIALMLPNMAEDGEMLVA
jgi:hypothetical protein